MDEVDSFDEPGSYCPKCNTCNTKYIGKIDFMTLYEQKFTTTEMKP